MSGAVDKLPGDTGPDPTSGRARRRARGAGCARDGERVRCPAGLAAAEAAGAGRPAGGDRRRPALREADLVEGADGHSGALAHVPQRPRHGGARDRLLVQVPAGTPTIESYLSEQLGQDIVVSLYLGSARANRKPILQLLTPEGGTFGYAKIGVNQLTKVLVGAERDALVRLYEADMSGLKVPSSSTTGFVGN